MSIIKNKEVDFYADMSKGLYSANSDLISYLDPDGHMVIRKSPDENKTIIIGISDGGHYPMYQGYVGKGFLDGCVIGDLFSTPLARQIYDVVHFLDKGKGTLLIYGNDYEGVEEQISKATALLQEKGHHIITYAAHDNAVIIPPVPFEKRVSTPGTILLAKIASSAAENGESLESIAALIERCGANLRSMGAIARYCVNPITGLCKNKIPEGFMNIGGQYHGEIGFETISFPPAEIMAEHMLRKMINLELCLKPGDRAVILITGLGATPQESLFIYYNNLKNVFEQMRVHIVKAYIGNYASSLDTNGINCSVLKLDTDEEKYLLTDTKTIIHFN